MRCSKIPRLLLIYCFGFLFFIFFTLFSCSSSVFAYDHSGSLSISDFTSNYFDFSSLYSDVVGVAPVYLSVSGSYSFSGSGRASFSYVSHFTGTNTRDAASFFLNDGNSGPSSGSFNFSYCGHGLIYNSSSSLGFRLSSFYDFTSLSFDYVISDTCPSSSSPSGSLTISENGTYDVSSYAEAVVDVPSEVIQGDYHDDLVSIKTAILICGSILLVIYFFFCIYRMFIKPLGGL